MSRLKLVLDCSDEILSQTSFIANQPACQTRLKRTLAALGAGLKTGLAAELRAWFTAGLTVLLRAGLTTQLTTG